VGVVVPMFVIVAAIALMVALSDVVCLFIWCHQLLLCYEGCSGCSSCSGCNCSCWCGVFSRCYVCVTVAAVRVAMAVLLWLMAATATLKLQCFVIKRNGFVFLRP
jgi:hypothetical protein